MNPNLTQWHQLIGKLFELLLAGFEVEVHTDFKLMSEPPRADIIILRRKTGVWQPEDLARLPDGVRHSQASHLLLEFKYTEPLTGLVLEKTFGYDIFYRSTQQLAPEQVSTFVLSARPPPKGCVGSVWLSSWQVAGGVQQFPADGGAGGGVVA